MNAGQVGCQPKPSAAGAQPAILQKLLKMRGELRDVQVANNHQRKRHRPARGHASCFELGVSAGSDELGAIGQVRVDREDPHQPFLHLQGRLDGRLRSHPNGSTLASLMGRRDQNEMPAGAVADRLVIEGIVLPEGLQCRSPRWVHFHQGDGIGSFPANEVEHAAVLAIRVEDVDRNRSAAAPGLRRSRRQPRAAEAPDES